MLTLQRFKLGFGRAQALRGRVTIGFGLIELRLLRQRRGHCQFMGLSFSGLKRRSRRLDGLAQLPAPLLDILQG